MWGISSWLLEQSSTTALTLDEGYLLTSALLDLHRGMAPLGPPAPAQSPLLGLGVAPPCHCLWPWAWGGSSRLLSLASDAGYFLPAVAPDLGHGVARHCCHRHWQVMVERSDRMWSTGEGNGKPLQYSCLENPMNSMKRQNDGILKEVLPRSAGAQYATGGQWRNNSTKNEGMEPKENKTQLSM